MLPQDGRSPVEQQRWIDAINVDTVDIPPYGCCEIVTNNVIGDRTRLQVRRPTADGLPQVVLNGLKIMPAGGGGFVTRDYPAFALATGAVGDMQGSQANSFTLKASVPGFILLGPGQAGAGEQRVMYFYQSSLLFTATLSGTLCSSDATANITGAKFLQSCKDIDITTAANTMGLAGPNGAKVYGLWDCTLDGGGGWALFQVKHREQQVIKEVFGDPDDCAIMETYIAKVALMYCTDPADKVAVQFYTTPVVVSSQLTNSIDRVSGVDSGDCVLTNNVLNICTLNDISDADPNLVPVIAFSSVPVLNNITQDGLNINGTWIDVFVPCYTAPYNDVLLTLEDCPKGSGSGGSTG